MPGPYSSKAVANALLQRAFNKRQTITHLKLQKLTFLAHGYYLAISDVPLVDEPFEAWDYGPVCRGIYQEFRDFGRKAIDRLALEVDWNSDSFVPVPVPESDKQLSRVADFVIDQYGDTSPFVLSDISHKAGWAWDRTRKADSFKLKNKDIPNDKIKEDFTPLVKKKAEA